MIEIIPATDIIGGQCVRLTQGDYASRKTYYRDPLEAALRFEEAGIRHLHMVDLDGAKASEPRNLAVLERIAARTSLEVQYGGGIKSREALHWERTCAPDVQTATTSNPFFINMFFMLFASSGLENATIIFAKTLTSGF